MNDIQKAQIRELRLRGVGYRKIAKETGMSENTVKSYCRRHPLSPKEPETEQAHHCLQCGQPIEQNGKRKEKKFCSSAPMPAGWPGGTAIGTR